MHFRHAMKYVRSMIARIRAWWTRRTHPKSAEAAFVLTFGPPIYRDITPQGVRVYSLCGGCGARLECSATLCQECAQGPHTSAF
jgi:hypothetical protein